jgi:hypothetical protein
MKRLVLALALTSLMLLLAVSTVAAHTVPTPQGCVSLAAGHLSALHGHLSAIAHSGGAVVASCTGDEVNPNAPERTNVPPGHQP